jgi:prefoldin subunit 2
MSQNQNGAEDEALQQIINQYKMMRQQIQTLAGKISELDAERNEHELVLRTIMDLDKSRRCFRSIGGQLANNRTRRLPPTFTQPATICLGY